MLYLFAMVAALSASQTDTVVGRWRTPEQNAIIEIARCGESICGKLVDSDTLKTNPNAQDTRNKETALRGRKLLNLQILQGFQWKSGAWSGGKIYNAQDGGIYSATVTSTGPNQLKLKGCIVRPLCQSQTWTRVR